MKRENEIYPRSIADGIVREFEEILEAYGVFVPDKERAGNEPGLSGDAYYGLVDVIEERITRELKRMKDHPGTVIVEGIF